MAAIVNAALVARELLVAGRFAEFAKRCLGLLHERTTTLGLRRDLNLPLDMPKAKVPLTIRPIAQDDMPALVPAEYRTMPRRERLEVAVRRAHIAANIPSCYVAIDQQKGLPCYMQWLMDHEQNKKIQEFFPKNWFPILNRNEALLENAYTPEEYRGQGIMSAAMAMIAERASEKGARYVVTFVDSRNAASLRGCAKAGFSPYLTRIENKFLFGLIRTRVFRPFALQGSNDNA